MAKALFATTAYLKENTVIDENVDDKLLTHMIEDAQDLKIEPILGTDLYVDLMDKVIAGTIAGNDKTLLDDYVFPTLKYYIVAEATWQLTVRFRNKGTEVMSSENAQAANRSDRQTVTSRYEDKAEEMAQRTINYLCENEDLFPLYSENTTHDKIKPITNSANVSIYLPDRSRRLRKSAEERYG